MSKAEERAGCKLVAWGSYYECTGDYNICSGCPEREKLYNKKRENKK